MELFIKSIHLVLYNCLTGELLALTWCIISHILKSPLSHTFLLYWDDIECLESIFNFSTYEIMISATYLDETGFEWWLKSLYYLTKCPSSCDSQDHHAVTLTLMRNNLIQLKLLRWWIAMNVNENNKISMNNMITGNTCDHNLNCFSMVTTSCERTSEYVYSFSSKQSFLFIIVARNMFLEALDLFLSSNNMNSFLEAISLHPLHQQLQFHEVVSNLPGITIACFELLEDAILMKNEFVIAICAEICCLSVQSMQHIGAMRTTDDLMRCIHSMKSNHYLNSVHQHLTVNLSNWNDLATGRTSVDPTLIIELVDIIEKFQTAADAEDDAIVIIE
jgi:hypothetical protein